MIRRFRAFARQQKFVLAVGVVAAMFVLSGSVEVTSIPSIIDDRVLLVLFALLVSVELLRQSGYLTKIVIATVRRFHRPRTFVLALVLITGALSAVVTNDVALFIVIPMTVVAGSMIRFSVPNAVVLEVIAANLLGALTPLGNPQNLYVYYLTDWMPLQFIAVMTPFVLVSLAGLAVAVVATEPPGAVSFVPSAEVPVRPSRCMIGLVILLLVLAEIVHLISPLPAAAAAALAALMLLRPRIADMGLSIIPLFFFAFIIVAGLRRLDLYDSSGFVHASEGATFGLIVLTSQIISNVPATVLFAPLVDSDWRLLLYAANAGGCGTIVASLANLLGWRIWVREGGESKFFLRRLFLFNAIFLAWTGLASWIILRLG